MVQKFIDINQKQSCFQTGPNSRIFLVTAIGSFFLVTAVGSYTSRFRQCLPYLISELLTQSTCGRLPRPLQAGMLFGLWISARYTSPGGPGTRISLNYGPLPIVSTSTKSKRIVIGGLTHGNECLVAQVLCHFLSELIAITKSISEWCGSHWTSNRHECQ